MLLAEAFPLRCARPTEPGDGAEPVSKPKEKVDVLLAYMAEHYEHARSHEHLRSNMSAITISAAAVIFGVALQSNGQHPLAIFLMGVLVSALGSAGLLIGRIHRNRFRAHRDAAGAIRKSLENALWEGEDLLIRPSQAREVFRSVKSFRSLDKTWNTLHVGAIIIGVVLAVSSMINNS